MPEEFLILTNNLLTSLLPPCVHLPSLYPTTCLPSCPSLLLSSGPTSYHQTATNSRSADTRSTATTGAVTKRAQSASVVRRWSDGWPATWSSGNVENGPGTTATTNARWSWRRRWHEDGRNRWRWTVGGGSIGEFCLNFVL